MNITTEEKSLNLLDFFIFVRKNIVYLLILFFIIFGFIFGFYLSSFTFKNETNFNKIILNIKNPNVIEKLNQKYFINEGVLKEALVRSNIDGINIDINFLGSFTLVDGEYSINNFNEFLTESDFQEFAKEIAVKPEALKDYLANIMSSTDSYKTLYINRANINLSDNELAILVQNLTQIVNERLNNDISLSGTKMKSLSLFQFDSDDLNLNKGNNYIRILESYVDELNDYSFYSPAINLDQIQSDILYARELYRELVTYSKLTQTFMEENFKIKLFQIENEIEFTERLLDKLNTNNSNLNERGQNFNDNSDDKNVPSNSMLSVDSSFVEKMIDIGNILGSASLRDKYINNLYELGRERAEILSEIEYMKIDRDSAYNKQGLIIGLNSLLTDITNDMNSYLISINSLDYIKTPVVVASKLTHSKLTKFEQIKDFLIMSLLTSILLSIGIFFSAAILSTIGKNPLTD